MRNLVPLQKKISIEFKNHQLLDNVFVHRSYLNEHRTFPMQSNEKLEFGGDSVLSLITSVYLYRYYPNFEEGDYTEIKASLVRTETLAEVAHKLDLGMYIYLSKGQTQEQGFYNKNILADCFEALIGAIFLDRGFSVCYKFVVGVLFKGRIENIIEKKLYLSPKSRLQEYTQAKLKITPYYEVVEEKGPEHNRTYKVQVVIRGTKYGLGIGKSKKEAEEEAAKKTLEQHEKV